MVKKKPYTIVSFSTDPLSINVLRTIVYWRRETIGNIIKLSFEQSMMADEHVRGALDAIVNGAVETVPIHLRRGPPASILPINRSSCEPTMEELIRFLPKSPEHIAYYRSLLTQYPKET